MKQVTVILFFFIYLFSSTCINQFQNIDVLIQHFHETQKKDIIVTFSQFLFMHYITSDLDNKDNDRDMQLPFKSIETNISISYSIYTSDHNNAVFAAITFRVNQRQFFIPLNSFRFPEYHFMIWHPPKYV